MRIRRLGWSGVEVEHAGNTLLVDYVLDTSELPLRGDQEAFPQASRPGGAVAALVTHLHPDHADPIALRDALAPGAPVFRPRAAVGTEADLALTAYAEAAFTRTTLNVHVVDVWTERTVGPFRLATAPAVDGFGDLQYSWVIECAGRRILHAGDTLFHGDWWRIARRYGPFDLAFLPINAPRVDFPVLQPPSGLDAVMGPEEAVTAARILGARTVTPIHYGALHRPPVYVETPDAVARLLAAGAFQGVAVAVREPGAWFQLDSPSRESSGQGAHEPDP